MAIRVSWEIKSSSIAILKSYHRQNHIQYGVPRGLRGITQGIQKKDGEYIKKK
jgi:hypothetical protein